MATYNAIANTSALSTQTGANRLSPLSSTIAGPPIPTSVNPYRLFPTTLGGSVSLFSTFLLSRDSYDALDDDHASITNNYFENVYVLPASMNFGIVLSTVTQDVTVYNAYRESDVSWTVYDDSALGIGTSLVGIPSLPHTFTPLSGDVYTFTVTTDGPPFVDASLLFTFSPGGTTALPVTFQRAVVFPYEPETPVVETMNWVTDVLESRDGTEQRRALRETPRLVFDMQIFVHAHERRKLTTTVLGGQNLALGLPLWWNMSRLTSDAAISDTTINVNTTQYRDYRVDGLAVLLNDVDDFEALQIQSFTNNTITFSSPLTKSFLKGSARVMPVSIGYLNGVIRRTRFRTDLERWSISFRVLDNKADYASTAAWSDYNDGTTTRVLLDTPNYVDGPSIQESVTRTIQIIDADQVGVQTQFTYQDISRIQSQWGHITTDQQSQWELRQLLYALRGRQVSFWLPTFAEDIEPVNVGLSALSNAMEFKNIGYTVQINGVQPRQSIRLTLTDGTVLIRKITSSTEVSASVESITVDSNWGVNATPEEIRRIEFVEPHRFNADSIEVYYRTGTGVSSVVIPTKAVLD